MIYDEKSITGFKDFCVNIGYMKIRMNAYFILCKKYSIPYREDWNATGNYYGLTFQKPHSGPSQFAYTYSIEEFEKALKNTIKINTDNYSII